MLTYTISLTGSENLYSRKVYVYTDSILTRITETRGNGLPLKTTTYTSDRMGNPVSRTVNGSTMTMTWGEGRMLTGVSMDENNYIHYDYNADGLRTAKTKVQNGAVVSETQYIWGENGLVGTVRSIFFSLP